MSVKPSDVSIQFPREMQGKIVLVKVSFSIQVDDKKIETFCNSDVCYKVLIEVTNPLTKERILIPVFNNLLLCFRGKEPILCYTYFASIGKVAKEVFGCDKAPIGD